MSDSGWKRPRAGLNVERQPHLPSLPECLGVFSETRHLLVCRHLAANLQLRCPLLLLDALRCSAPPRLDEPPPHRRHLPPLHRHRRPQLPHLSKQPPVQTLFESYIQTVRIINLFAGRTCPSSRPRRSSEPFPASAPSGPRACLRRIRRAGPAPAG